MKIVILPQGTMAIYEQIVKSAKKHDRDRRIEGGRGAALNPLSGGGAGRQCDHDKNAHMRNWRRKG